MPQPLPLLPRQGAAERCAARSAAPRQGAPAEPFLLASVSMVGGGAEMAYAYVTGSCEVRFRAAAER